MLIRLAACQDGLGAGVRCCAMEGCGVCVYRMWRMLQSLWTTCRKHTPVEESGLILTVQPYYCDAKHTEECVVGCCWSVLWWYITWPRGAADDCNADGENAVMIVDGLISRYRSEHPWNIGEGEDEVLKLLGSEVLWAYCDCWGLWKLL